MIVSVVSRQGNGDGKRTQTPGMGGEGGLKPYDSCAVTFFMYIRIQVEFR